MSIFKCKMCGGTLELSRDETVGICEYCGTRQTLPKLGDEQKANLYERANHLRRNNEYDKAMGIYEEILNKDATDAESYWSLVLCRYGIEYVEDPATHKRVPTVNRAQFTSVFADEDYKSAIEHADGAQREIYEHEAKMIDDIQKGILAISQKEKPFDVFICYKETDANGRRTPDSVLATDLYHQLKQEGFNVFFSRITLEDKLGVEYEPYIFAALNSAKVMVVLGTKPEHFNAVWVKNEWSRYLALIKNGAKKMLIPAYRDMDPYNLPEEFSHLQAQDMSKLGFMQDLIRGIKKIVSSETSAPAVKETVVVNGTANANAAPLLRRVFIFLEDGDFANADEYCEKVLDMEPENAEAYLGKMMAELRVRKREDLALFDEPFDENANYKRALRFADETFAEELRGYIYTINERKENRRLESLYRNCVRVMETSKTEEDYINAAKNFEELGSFGSSAEMANRCRAKAEEIKTAKLDAIYNNCIAKMNSAKTEADYKKAADFFKNISGYREADEMAKICLENAEKVRLQGIYDSAKAKMAENKIKSYEQAIDIFRSISAFKDSENQVYFCQGKIEEIKAKEAEERIERERKAELKRIADQERRENAKRLAKIWSPIVAGVLAFAILLNYVVIPNFDYIKAEINTMVEEAKAEKAEKDAERARKKAEREAAKAEKDNKEDVSEEPVETVTLSEVEVGDTITFGSYEQDNNLENGAEPIEWQVLDIQNGKALVISKFALDCKPYNSEDKSVTWEHSSLREWLNNDFINSAFSLTEQTMISVVKLSNSDNRIWTYDGSDTEDKIFLLSINQAENYFSSDAQRQCIPSAYAKAEGVKISANGNCYWWLRSPGNKETYAAVVDCDGDTYIQGYVANFSIYAVRPAMWIDISAEEQAETVTFSEVEVGDTITFGSYEQDNNLKNGAEPIEWQVLDIKDGKAFVISKYGLDCQPYNIEKGSITWGSCSLRKWLNDDFINSAFIAEEQNMIITTKLSLSSNKTYSGDDTEDKIFLLNVDETQRYFSSSEERKCEPSSYAKEQGVSVADNGKCWWWLISPGGPSAKGVDYFGVVSNDGAKVSKVYYAVRPAMWIDISGEPQEPVIPEEISVGDVVTFGSYEQDNNLENGAEPIEWQVLDVKDGKALVISKYGLDCQPYNTEYKAVTWENCSLRKWLNSDFINSALNTEEQKNILITKITNPDNPKFGTEGGSDTLDKIFILSIEEAEKYFTTKSQIECKATNYAKARKANTEDNDNCWWWLRTLGTRDISATAVKFDEIVDFGYGINVDTIVVRPTMWIDLAAFEEPQEPVVSEEISIGDVVTFGSYEQDNNLENGAEPIEWQVLDVQDGKALIISKYGLDCKPYNTESKSVTWETCSLRKWLNSDFINSAFDENEQKIILATKLSNPNNSKYGATGGKDTEDKAFLLNIEETDKYFASSKERICILSKHATMGSNRTFSNGSEWYLRSPGVDNTAVAFVSNSGGINYHGYGVNYYNLGIRPAMWIDISVEKEQTETVPLSEATVGDYVIFGSYEQDNNLENGAEPIEWQVLDVKDGKALVISKYGLDCKPYDNNKYGTDTWETCSLRKWLNSNFIKNAFNTTEKEKIITTQLSNPDNPKYGTEGGNDTKDKVFLLSIEEAEKYFSVKDEGACVPSTYAKEQGAYTASNNNGWWWLRSPGTHQHYAARVAANGVVQENGYVAEDKGTKYTDGYAYNGAGGMVRPSMWIDISATE